MDRGPSWATVNRVIKSRIRLSANTFTFSFNSSESFKDPKFILRFSKACGENHMIETTPIMIIYIGHCVCYQFT